MRERPDLAKEVKKFHLSFEDIFDVLPDNLLRDLMNSVELDTVALALKGMSEEIEERVKENLPQKKQAMYEPVEGAIAKREIDRARKAIVQSARKMEKDGIFTLSDLTGGEEMID